jgi:hypothetical protein
MERDMRIRFTVLAAGPLCLLAATAVANWSSCGGNLRSVQSDARDAEAIARDLDRIEQAVDAAKREYDLCTGSPQIYDTLGDGCASQQLTYVSKLNDFNSAQSRLDAEINALLQRVTAAINDCR